MNRGIAFEFPNRVLGMALEAMSLRQVDRARGVMPKKLVTGAVPVYDRLEYLPHAPESVRRQDYRTWS